MRRLIPVFFVIILLSSCRKTESDFIWEKSYGKGEALFVKASSDSGFFSCGGSGGFPYFIRLNKTRNLIVDFKAEIPGSFSSVWFDTSGYITSGNTLGKILLMHHSPDGNRLWEKSIDAGFKVDYTNLYYSGSGNLLALATASPDSSGSGAAGLYFVRFDTTGKILSEKKITETGFIAARKAVVDNTGNIYLALTRRAAGSKAKASVAKYNNLFQKLWETELYNNPDFGAASLAVYLDGAGNIYISGNTEVSTKEGKLNNSFIASLSNAGSMRWKKYLENSNTGSSISSNSAGEIMMLNRNCFIVNVLTPSDGSDAGRIKLFSVCDSYNTDALGSDMDINYDKNMLVAGTRGGNFYLALKSAQ